MGGECFNGSGRSCERYRKVRGELKEVMSVVAGGAFGFVGKLRCFGAHLAERPRKAHDIDNIVNSRANELRMLE